MPLDEISYSSYVMLVCAEQGTEIKTNVRSPLLDGSVDNMEPVSCGMRVDTRQTSEMHRQMAPTVTEQNSAQGRAVESKDLCD